MNEKEIILDDFKIDPISSAEMVRPEAPAIKETEGGGKPETKVLVDTDVSKDELEAERSPAFRELAEPKLPDLVKDDRAWLQIQSPNRLYFYWSMKNNPYQTLSRAFKEAAGNYRLVVRLVNVTRDTEEMHPVEARGNWWFDAEANSLYRAEVGFYATNRPFVRILGSNTIETPRKSPSPRRDYTPYFDVSAREFAEVLDQAGYKQDAWEVALAGDDRQHAAAATHNAFAQLTGKSGFHSADDSDMRFALLALAARARLEELEGQIGRELYAALRENAAVLSAEKARRALQQHFGVSDEIVEIEEAAAASVVGASLVNFPRVIKRRKVMPKQFVPKFSPVSSFGLGKM